MPILQKTDLTEDRESHDAFQVICLCAEWCSTCRDYQSGFSELAFKFPDIHFRWVDIEECADDLGDLDIENFPTLLVLRENLVLFYGTMLPYLSHLRRTIETFLEQTPEQSREYAFSNAERRGWQAEKDLKNIPRLTSRNQ